MRIAQISPLYERVPPKQYGGTERIVHYLTEELVQLGHEVTLFASGDSITSARLVSTVEYSLRQSAPWTEPVAQHFIMMERVFRMAEAFDILHFHIDYMHFPWSRRGKYSHVTTLHGRLDIPDLKKIYREYPSVPVLSISDAQRRPLPWLNWQGTVLHGIPPTQYRFQEAPGEYLAFLGRISPEKRPDRAIEIARRSGKKLKMAAKVDAADKNYFEKEIRPLIQAAPYVEFVGEISDSQKNEFLGNASALLFPIDWPEPFGLVMIEALACGTPVVAFEGGSVREVIRHGRTGYIVHDIEEAVAAIRDLPQISRAGCRREFERRFTARRMAEDYLDIYQRLAEKPFAEEEALWKEPRFSLLKTVENI